jgi:hypothetical protein
MLSDGAGHDFPFGFGNGGKRSGGFVVYRKSRNLIAAYKSD